MSFEDDFEVGDGYEGVQEAPIPEVIPSSVNRQKPKEAVKRDYNSKSASGARQARTEEINQGYSQPGQTIKKQANQSGQGQASQPRQGNQGQPRQSSQGQAQGGQGQVNQPRQGGQPSRGKGSKAPNTQPRGSQQAQVPPQGNPPQQPPKKKSKLPMILGVVGIVAVLGVAAVVGSKFLGGNKLVPQEQSYEQSGRYALDTLQNAVNNFDATAIDTIVGVEEGDSYLGQEWAYVNGVKLREEFIQKVGALVTFTYPQVQQMSTTGVGMVDEAGSPLMIESYMNSGESVKVTIPDYDKLSATMDEDIKFIQHMFKSSKYSEEDYTWHDEMANLMLQYICDKDSIPTKEVELALPIRLNTEGQPYIEDDALLDDALFGSDEFHNMCAKFSQLCLGWTGFKDEAYTVQEEQHNTEYDEWYALFIVYYEADNGKFNKYTSKWEPWYLRDANDNYIYDDNGEKVVNYYSIKDENGNDWIQPDETILVDVEKIRQVEDPWVEETAILYNWIGQNYIKNKYSGVGDVTVRVGDGSAERPAGIGTTVITKMLGTDGKYHDVKVAMLGYWTEQNAIDYAETFSTKNKGFTTSSVVQLICYEISIENLEDKPVTFMSSEMTLADRNRNISSRTGTMYGFSEEVTIKPDEVVVINDWATSTELAQKYVCWGKSFGRQYDMVFFDVLAGTGNIPTYSAYEQFTGKSTMDESIDTGANNQ